MKISTITCSDPREDTSVDKLIEFMNEFSDVEIAVQASEAKIGMGTPRRVWFDELLHAVRNNPRRLNLAMHVNMEYCEKFSNGEIPADLAPWFFAVRSDDMQPVIKRWQINYSGSKCSINPYRVMDMMGKYLDHEFIMQHNSTNASNMVLQRLQKIGTWIKFSVLYDASGGAGKLPTQWHAPYAHYKTGYSGGLGAENIAMQLDNIATVAGDRIVWIDAEGKLKIPGTKTFDIARAREYVLAANQWIKKSGR